MSVNKNCLFALALREGESTHISAIDNFQFWNNSFTLTMSFFQTGESDEVVLFNQEGIIKVGYRNSIFYVKVSDKEFLSDEGRMVVMPKVWNSISVAYDVSSKIVSAYINGIKDFEADLALEGELPVINSTGDYVLGEKFIGYFRKVFCYAGIHTEDEMFQIDNIDPVDATEHEFYLDFSAKEPKDIGKYGKNIFTTCFAFNKNIVPTINFGECGYISSEGSEEVLSDDYTESAFTIVSKIYISDSRSSHILFAKESESCNGFFIGVFCTDGNPRLFFKNGETNVAIDRTLPLYTWLDLAFVCSNKRIQVFCDGEEFGECELPGELAFSSNKFTIGNAATQSSYKSFCGYIDYVAVFNGVKAKDELKKYISDIPYIYSKDISALYYLSDVNAVELINSKKIIINESVCCFAEDTQRVETDMLTYDNECENEISISSYDQWQGSLAAGLFLGSISSMGIRHRFGLDSNGMPTQSVAREFTKRVSSIPEHMEICLNSTSITPAMTQSYLSALESAGILGSLGTLFGISSFEVDKFAIAILGAAAIGACSVLIATACEKGSDIILNNDNKEPPEQDPEDEKTVVYLKSITFAHNPQDKSSAVYLRRSENQSTSEWELGRTEATDALYIADRHEIVTVKATFVVNKPFSGSIGASAEKAGECILGNLITEKIIIDALPSYPAEKEVTFKLERGDFKSSKLGCYTDTWKWFIKDHRDALVNSTNTSHRTWILETEPLEQWNILEKDEARNISVDILKIIHTIKDYHSFEETNSGEILNDFDSWRKHIIYYYHESNKIKYANKSNDNYSNIYDSSLAFDVRKFESEFTGKEINMTSLDVTVSISVLFSLLSYDCNVAYLLSDDGNEVTYYYDEINNKVIGTSDMIVFQNVIPIGEQKTVSFINLEKHFVLCDTTEKTIIVYDPCFRVLNDVNESKFIINIPFTEEDYVDDIMCTELSLNTYREMLVPVGNSLYFSWRKYKIELFIKAIEDDTKCIQGIEYNQFTQTYQYLRDSFSSKSMLLALGLDPNDYRSCLCHRISCNYIGNLVVEVFNKLNSTTTDNQERNKYCKALMVLISGVFGVENGLHVDKFQENHDHNLADECYKIVNYLSNNMYIGTTERTNCQRYINSLLNNLMANSYFNVKKGNFSWNASIRDSYDVGDGWKYIYQVEENSGVMSEYETRCFNKSVTQSYLMDRSEDFGLYLSFQDSFQIQCMYYIQLLIGIKPLFPKIYSQHGGKYGYFGRVIKVLLDFDRVVASSDYDSFTPRSFYKPQGIEYNLYVCDQSGTYSFIANVVNP